MNTCTCLGIKSSGLAPVSMLHVALARLCYLFPELGQLAVCSLPCSADPISFWAKMHSTPLCTCSLQSPSAHPGRHLPTQSVSIPGCSEVCPRVQTLLAHAWGMPSCAIYPCWAPPAGHLLYRSEPRLCLQQQPLSAAQCSGCSLPWAGQQKQKPLNHGSCDAHGHQVPLSSTLGPE